MHVGFICNEYPPDPHGGIGSVTRTLAQTLARRHHRVSVVGYTIGGVPGVSWDEGVKVVRLPHARIPGTGLVVNAARLRHALLDMHASDPFDIIEGPENSFASFARRLRPLAVIRMHGGHHFFSVTLGREPRLQRRWIERRSFANAAHLCAVSQFVATKTLQLLDQTNRPVQILPNPVDTSMFTPREGSEEHASIVFAGTICEKKGVRQLLGAMRRVLSVVPDAHLYLVGRDSLDADGRSFTERMRSALHPSLREHVTFEGTVAHQQMPARLARAAVCVYPSHMEALPLAWLEAMAMGKCVIASMTGPGSEVIVDGDSGLLCNPYDAGDIAEKLVAALTQPLLRQRLGDAARRRVVSHFSQDALAGRNEAFYERCTHARCA
jgi:glycosyltransferase involved in cell wall biosynthesis